MGPHDTALIARVLTHDDRHAFATLVRRHQSAVRIFLRRLTGQETALADDLAQETFVRAYRNLAQYRGGARFETWLYGIGYRLFLSERRRRGGRGEELSAEAVSHDATERVEARHDLGKAWSLLRSEEQVALALTYMQDLTHEEAAQIMECPLGTLKALVLRGKEKLRLAMAPPPGPGKERSMNDEMTRFLERELQHVEDEGFTNQVLARIPDRHAAALIRVRVLGTFTLLAAIVTGIIAWRLAAPLLSRLVALQHAAESGPTLFSHWPLLAATASVLAVAVIGVRQLLLEATE